MKKYSVEVIETLSRIIEVEALNFEEAENIVASMYNGGNIVLDWQDLKSTEYREFKNLNIMKETKEEKEISDLSKDDKCILSR